MSKRNPKQILNCYFTFGPIKRKLKRLSNIAIDSGVSASVGGKLDELKSLLANFAVLKI